MLKKEVYEAKNIINQNGYTINFYHTYLNEEKSLKSVDMFNQRVLDRMTLVKSHFVGTVNKDDYSFALNNKDINISVGGSKLVKEVMLTYKDIPKIKDIKIMYMQNSKLIEVDNIDYSVKGRVVTLHQYLLPNTKNFLLPKGLWYTKKYVPGTYMIAITDSRNTQLTDVSFKFENINNEVISAYKKENIKLTSFDKNLKNIVNVENKHTSEFWSGIKKISGFNILDKDITIEAGTKIVFDENATLKVLGKVTAIGTKENPIIFEAKDKTKPWNAFALKDAKANGSVFKHCIFKDGSGDKGDLYEYTAMFSVHNVKDLLVEDCAFYDSHRTDDMVHVIYSDVTFKNTKFVRSLSDALDIDISNATIDNCEFIDSGNDSIDLMTTNAIVTNTIFLNSVDKAISIGEGSNLLAVNNLIKESEIGMQSKDTSKAYIYNTSFLGNKKAVDAYHKNWRYSDGGTIILDKCKFEENIINATVGKKSKVVINDSSIDTPEKFNSKSLLKKKIIISNDGLVKYDLKGPLFQNKIHLINKEIRGYNE